MGSATLSDLGLRYWPDEKKLRLSFFADLVVLDNPAQVQSFIDLKGKPVHILQVHPADYVYDWEGLALLFGPSGLVLEVNTKHQQHFQQVHGEISQEFRGPRIFGVPADDEDEQ